MRTGVYVDVPSGCSGALLEADGEALEQCHAVHRGGADREHSTVEPREQEQVVGEVREPVDLRFHRGFTRAP